MAEYTYSNKFENQFWLQILSDTLRIIYQALPTFDKQAAQEAEALISQFDKLLERSRANLTPDQMAQLNTSAYKAVQSIHQYFLNLLNKQLLQSYPLLVKPSIINDGITFAEHYMYLINKFNRSARPLLDVRYLDVFWLPTVTTSAKIISDSVGSYNSDIKQALENYAARFANLLIFSIELQGEYRLETTDFPIAIEHRLQVLETLKSFQMFLKKLLILVQQNKIPGTLTPLYVERLIRMVCYYEIQLSQISNLQKPDCNPLNPRVSEI